MNQNDLIVAIQFVLEDFLKRNPDVSGEYLKDIVEEALDEFIEVNGLEEEVEDFE